MTLKNRMFLFQMMIKLILKIDFDFLVFVVIAKQIAYFLNRDNKTRAQKVLLTLVNRVLIIGA